MTATSPEVVRGNPDSPVAVCTLSSHALLDGIARSPIAPQIAMLGPLETENLGIERMLTTLLRTPRIRWLVVCGDESRGRYQGQALAALFENGIQPDGKIPNARSRRALIKALTAEQVDIARRQVRLRDIQGTTDLDLISVAIADALADDPGLFTAQVALPETAPIDVPSRPFRLQEHDPAGFFIVLLDRNADRLLVEHYTADGLLAHRIQGPDAESLCGSLIEWGLLSRLDHAAYMGRELAKAEAALRLNIPYRQDDPVPSPPAGEG